MIKKFNKRKTPNEKIVESLIGLLLAAPIKKPSNIKAQTDISGNIIK